MPVNFDALVLAPCMRAFAIPVMMDPQASMPLASPYPTEGIFSSRPREVMLQDGTIVADMETTLGIRMSDFLAPPTTKDQITLQSTVMDVDGNPIPAGTTYWVQKFNPDGQGGGMVHLRLYNPPAVLS